MDLPDHPKAFDSSTFWSGWIDHLFEVSLIVAVYSYPLTGQHDLKPLTDDEVFRMRRLNAFFRTPFPSIKAFCKVPAKMHLRLYQYDHSATELNWIGVPEWNEKTVNERLFPRLFSKCQPVGMKSTFFVDALIVMCTEVISLCLE